jgi:aspartate-semialdehyde dehydrogenase
LGSIRTHLIVTLEIPLRADFAYLCAMKVLIAGATGLVGQVMAKVLEERNFPVTELIAAASEQSTGKQVQFKGQPVTVVSMQDALDAKPVLAFFSMGSEPTREWAPKFTESGCIVIDNSSTYRLEDQVPLVVPEINSKDISSATRLIANPNCSTIQMVLALKSIQEEYGIKRIVVSTYQSVTGTGAKAVEQLENERQGIGGEQVYPHPIDLNCFPHGGDEVEDGYTTEEAKLVNETRKILGDDSIQVTATVVRIPVIGGHSESVNVELKQEYDLDTLKKQIEATPGISVLDDLSQNLYPTPQLAQGKDDVFVGRIRRDRTQAYTVNLWVVSDNLRKGAATNAIQIGEYLVEQGWLS